MTRLDSSRDLVGSPVGMQVQFDTKIPKLKIKYTQKKSFLDFFSS